MLRVYYWKRLPECSMDSICNIFYWLSCFKENLRTIWMVLLENQFTPSFPNFLSIQGQECFNFGISHSCVPFAKKLFPHCKSFWMFQTYSCIKGNHWPTTSNKSLSLRHSQTIWLVVSKSSSQKGHVKFLGGYHTMVIFHSEHWTLINILVTQL